MTSDSLTGMCAGPWRIEYELGRGGMGVVYAVVHVDIGKRAALKVLHRKIPNPERHAQRMMLEARVANAIDHPSIVDIFDVGTTEDGRPYIVMERLEGAPLSEIFISRRRAIEIMLEVCSALAAAHDAGVVHRDLKPENIFVGDQEVTVLDWGIARLIHAESMTIEGQVIGTPQYISPEQGRGEDVTPASDVYSLGVVAYELFTGVAPFQGVTAAEVMAMHLYMAPDPPDLANHALESLILDMLEKTPSDRPTIREVAQRLEASLQPQPVAFASSVDDDDAPLELPTRRTGPVYAGAIAIAGSAVVFMMRHPRPSTRSVAAAAPSPAAVSIAGPECVNPFVQRDGDRYVMTCKSATYQSPNLHDWQPSEPVTKTKPRAGDGQAFVDSDGKRYVYFKRAGTPATISVSAGGKTTDVLQANQPWENGNVEAPWVTKRDGYYYLFFSGAKSCDPSYAVGVARATSPLGPFEKMTQPIVATSAQWIAPGHVSIVDDRLVFHTYREPPSCERASKRYAELAPLSFVNGWPHVGP